MTPEKAKWIVAACALYIVLPDFVPVLGDFIDALALVLAVTSTKNAWRNQGGGAQ